MADTRFDSVLASIASAHTSLPALLGTIFAFLRRKTDFYIVDDSPTRKMGFAPGDAEAMVLNVLRSIPYQTPTGKALSYVEVQEWQQKLKSTAVPLKKDTPKKGDSSAAHSSTAASTPKKVAPTTSVASTVPLSDSESILKAESSTTVATTVSTPPTSQTPATKPKPSPVVTTSNTIVRHKRKRAAGEGDSSDDEVSGKASVAGEDSVQIPIGNGGVGLSNAYWWTQTISDTTLFIPVAPHIRGKDLNVNVTSNAIHIATKDGAVVLSGKLGGSVKSDAIWTLDATDDNIRNRPLDITQPPFKPDDNTTSIDEQAAAAGLFDPCKVLTVPLEKVTQTWWRSAVAGHPEVDPTMVDSTMSVSDYDAETQATIRKIVFDQGRKAAGLPTSDEEKAQSLLESAKSLPGSPFKP